MNYRKEVKKPNYCFKSANSFKAEKGQGKGYLNAVYYQKSGKDSCIDWKKCVAFCIDKTGMLAMPVQTRALKIRKDYWKFNFAGWHKIMVKNMKSHIRKAEKEGLKPAFRLNGSSDMRLDGMELAHLFPQVTFYDYTNDFSKYPSGNYHLTYSYKGDNWGECLKKLMQGFNVAVVFPKELPETWKGFKVIDGDIDDLRFLDIKGVIVGLSAKGQLRKEENKGIKA